MKKRLLASVLILLIMLPFYIFPAQAVNSPLENTPSHMSQILTTATAILEFIEPEKELYGTYTASTVATDGQFYYVESGSSTQYPMTGFLAVSQ